MPGHQSALSDAQVCSFSCQLNKITHQIYSYTTHQNNNKHIRNCQPPIFLLLTILTSYRQRWPKQTSSCARSAVELHAAPALVMAAPVLLGIWPTLHPIGEASTAVIDSAFRMSDTGRKNVSVKVVAAVPGSWASHASVVTAPRLLVRRPSKVPVRVAFMAIVSEVMLLLLVNDRCGAHIVSLVDHMRMRWHWHRHMNDVRRLMNGLINFVVDHFGVSWMINTSASEMVAAVFLLPRAPQVLPVVEAQLTIDRVICRGSWERPEMPQEEASEQHFSTSSIIHSETAHLSVASLKPMPRLPSPQQGQGKDLRQST